MDALITMHRKLQKVVDLCRVRPLAQKVFRRLHDRRYQARRLARATQNGRQWWLHPEVALRGEFQEFETIEWLREVIEPGMTVIDIGANVGQMTLEMAHLVGPLGRVIAIEPAPGNVELLREHVNANGFSGTVEIIAAACGDEDGGELDFVVYGAGTNSVGSGHQLLSVAGASESLRGKLESRALRIPTITCDALSARLDLEPRVLKVDVEGAEELVVQGARRVLSVFQPKVRLGFHPFAFADPQNVAERIRHSFDESGYRLDGGHSPSMWTLSEYVFVPNAGGRVLS